MYFIRKKKHERDQEAGLIFHWRGFRKHHLGKIVALLLVSVFFALSVYAVRIESIKAPLLSKKEGVVIMLNENDLNCQALMLQVEEHSPFPVRWDPALDEEVLMRVNEEKSLLQGELWDYKVVLKPLPEDKSSDELVSIVDSYDGLWGKIYNQWRQAELVSSVIAPADLIVRARVVAAGDLKHRISGDELALPVDLVADDDFGQVFRFQMGLDELGFVSTCIPLPGGTTDVAKITARQKKLAAWIRSHQFRSAEQGTTGLVTGQLELQIEVIRE